MEKAKLLIIEQKLNSLYKKNLVKKWPSDLNNAQLAIKYAWSSKTIFSLLKRVIFTNSLCLHKTFDPENIEIQNETVASGIELKIWGLFQSNLSEIEYFNTLPVSKWEYEEFIVSAFVFCIQNKLHDEFLLKNFVFISAKYVAPLFLLEDLLSSSIFSCIVELKLFDFFPSEATRGFIKYLEPSFSPQINIVGRFGAISKFLYVFSFFPVSFIKQCLLDCKQQNNSNPIILALYILYINSQSSKQETEYVCKKLENFKERLIYLKLINNEFPSQCDFSCFKEKKILFEKYYSSFKLNN